MANPLIPWREIVFHTYDGTVTSADPNWQSLLKELRQTGGILGGYLTASALERNDGSDDADPDWTGYRTSALRALLEKS